MKMTQKVGITLDRQTVWWIDKEAAAAGMTRTAFAAGLLLRGKMLTEQDRPLAVLERFEGIVARLEAVGGVRVSDTADKGEEVSFARESSPGPVSDEELRAFMIEVLVILRDVTKDRLDLRRTVGHKLESVVGSVRVEGA